MHPVDCSVPRSDLACRLCQFPPEREVTTSDAFCKKSHFFHTKKSRKIEHHECEITRCPAYHVLRRSVKVGLTHVFGHFEEALNLLHSHQILLVDFEPVLALLLLHFEEFLQQINNPIVVVAEQADQIFEEEDETVFMVSQQFLKKYKFNIYGFLKPRNKR